MEPLIVQKYGGTSVGSIERIRDVAKRVASYRRQGHGSSSSSSAMAGETNRLLELANELGAAPDPARDRRARRRPASRSRSRCSRWRSRTLGVPARSFLGHQVRIATDSAFRRARIRSIDDSAHRDALDAGTDRRRRRLPGRRRATATSRRSAAAAPTRPAVALAAALKRRCLRDLHGRRRRLHDRPAHRAARRASSTDLLRRDARAREPRRQGAADPLGRVRQASTASRSTCGRLQRRMPRARWSSRRTMRWKSWSSPVSPTTATRRRSRSWACRTGRASPRDLRADRRRRTSSST